MNSPRSHRARRLLPVGALAVLVIALGAHSARPLPAAAAPDVAVEADISIFFDALAPHGQWVDVAPYGWVFAPEVADYGWRPYTVGHWAYVDALGWVFVSDEPWGWAAYHYGRWTYDAEWGWVWIPGVVWAPAWVEFRAGDGWIGWAPLPPSPGWRLDVGVELAQVGVAVEVAPHAWTFTATRYFAEPALASHVFLTSNNPYLLRATSPVAGLSSSGGTAGGGAVIVNRAVDVAVVEKARGVPVPRLRVSEAAAGSDDPSATTRVEGDTLKIRRPRIAPKAPTAKPPAAKPTAQVPGAVPPKDAEAWLAARRAALEKHLDAQRKGLDQVPAAETEAGRRAMPADDVEKRRKATLDALEEERKRLESLLERQRRRHEHAGPAGSPEPQPTAGMDGDGRSGGAGMDAGMSDEGMNDGGMQGGGMDGGMDGGMNGGMDDDKDDGGKKRDR